MYLDKKHENRNYFMARYSPRGNSQHYVDAEASPYVDVCVSEFVCVFMYVCVCLCVYMPNIGNSNFVFITLIRDSPAVEAFLMAFLAIQGCHCDEKCPPTK